MTTASTYVYSNQAPQAVTHHRYLAELLDGYTVARIVGLQSNLDGLSCLEVGAGAGSVAAWLAGEVGEQGRVVATDLHPMPIPHMRRLTVLAHDITTQPVPRPPYDLVHARLVLQHLPERVEVLRTLANALVPGGVLVIEDWDMTWRAGRVLRTPCDADTALFEFFHDTLTNVFVAAGADPGWASKTPQAMVDAGLVDVDADVHARSWAGGTAGCRLVAGTVVQLRDQLIKEGLTPEELDRVRELMVDPRMVIRMPPLVSTAGFRR